MCIDTLGTTFKWRNTSIFSKNKFKTGKSFRRPPPNVMSAVAKRGTGKPPPNAVSAVAAKLGMNTLATTECHFGSGRNGHRQMKHFGGGLRPPPKRHSAVADVFVPSFAATAETAFSGGCHITCVLCLLFNLRPKLPSRCVVLGSWSIYFFGCCLVSYCRGLIRWILWLSGSPGKEHHARLVQGLSNWQVWAASPLATFCCIWSSGYTFG